jgi:hypothetical protein
MMGTEIKKKILQFCKDHFNEIVYMGCMSPARLVGFAEDAYDYYYVVIPYENNKFSDSPNGRVWHSAVDWCLPIKTRFEAREYEMVEHRFAINGIDPVDAFLELKDDGTVLEEEEEA